LNPDRRRGGCLVGALLALWAAVTPAEEINLKDLSLQRLMDIDVTSVSKRSQRLQDVAGSIYVITEEDIRRSGATRIQDVLNMAPGAWFEDASYNVSASAVRGTAFAFQETLLWLVDGVPVVNPTTGGVILGTFNVPLADIERIEVIKGPGGTIYGANAASGIISIFTRHGESADGLRVSLDAGGQKYFSPYARYGFEPRENLFVSLWGNLKTHAGYDRNPLFAGDSLMAPQPSDPPMKVANSFRGEDDAQALVAGGLKLEYHPSEAWTISGWLSQQRATVGQYGVERHAYPGPVNERPAPDSVFAAQDEASQTFADIRIDRRFAPNHSAFLNLHYWRNAYFMMIGHGFQQNYDITEAEFQDNLELGRHRFSAGADARTVRYDLSGLDARGSVFFENPRRDAYLASAFLQDEMTLGARWRLTLGSKAELWTLLSPVPEIMPSLRLAYSPASDLTFWAAASRSITNPSYSQTDMEFRQAQIPPYWVLRQDPRMTQEPPAAGKWIAIVSADENVKPAGYYTIEAGHRGMGGPRIQWDISAFYSWIKAATALTPMDSSLQTVIPSRARPGDSIVPLYNANLLDREDFGGEFLARLMPLDYLRLELSYSLYTTYHFHGLPIPHDPRGRNYEPAKEDLRTPQHVGRFKAYLDLPGDFTFTGLGILSSPFSRGQPFSYVRQDNNPFLGVTADRSRMQFHLDLIVQKRLYRDRITLTAWGRNLLADPFVETYNQYGWLSYPHQIHRTFGAGLEYRF
jgi:outer membrane receptor protein involved in Fe transport